MSSLFTNPTISSADGGASSDPAMSRRIELLVNALRSLRGAEMTVLDLIACGPAAVPALKRFLFRREASGIFEPRGWAARALVGIGARDALIEFLKLDREISDPVERLGEEAAINATARALRTVRSDHEYEILIELARRRPLAGVIEVLGELRRADILPILIDALDEDFSRGAAEEALRKIGAIAGPALCGAALRLVPSPEYESPSSVRRRRSALRLLVEMGLAQTFWGRLEPLVFDPNENIAAIAGGVAIGFGSEAQRQTAATRLVALLQVADWLLRSEIEGYLISHFYSAKTAVDEALAAHAGDQDGANLRVRRALARVVARANTQRESLAAGGL